MHGIGVELCRVQEEINALENKLSLKKHSASGYEDLLEVRRLEEKIKELKREYFRTLERL